MNERLEKIIDIVKRVKPSLENVDKDTVLNEGALDSLDIITVVTLLEREFDIKIAGICLKQENFRTVESLLKMIENLDK